MKILGSSFPPNQIFLNTHVELESSQILLYPLSAIVMTGWSGQIGHTQTQTQAHTHTHTNMHQFFPVKTYTYRDSTSFTYISAAVT